MSAPIARLWPVSFLLKHFRGDYSLARSYWVNMLLIQMFAPLLGITLVPWTSANLPARYGCAGVLLVTVLGILAWLWAMTGTWRSADKHVGRGGSRGWAMVAQLMIGLGALRTCGGLWMQSGALAEHWRVALGKQPGPEVTLELAPDGHSIRLRGGMNDGTAAALAEALDRAPSVTTVVLDSPGGWVRQGRILGKLIEERRLDTHVDDECSSAATIAFLGGAHRTAGPLARIGFHSFKSVGDRSRPGVTSAADEEQLWDTYVRAGLSSKFIEKVARTPNVRVWYPTSEELLEAGVLTSAGR